ncbi:MAG: hypothetical protein Kow0059_17890 [Candidatus Sumerlaeia bacterium]
MEPSSPAIALDVRFWAHSGIGTYLQTLVAWMGTQTAFLLIGPQEFISRAGKYGDPHQPPVNRPRGLYEFDAAMYAWRVHFGYPLRGDEGLVLHYPHYNLPLCYRGPAVVNVFDLAHWRLPESPMQRWHSGLLLSRLRRRKRGLILVPSDFIAGELIELGFPESRLRVVPLTLHPDFWHVYQSRRRGEETGGDRKSVDGGQEAPPPQPYFLTIGILKERKNLTGLLRILDFLWARRCLDTGLVMAGLRPCDVASLEKRRKRLKCPERLTLVAQTTRARLISLMRGAQAVLFPSLYEGFGLPVLEAMACGTPVVCSKAPPLDVLFGEGVMGFDPENSGELADALQVISSDAAARRDLCARADALVLRYSPTRFIQDMREVYESVFS